MRFLRRSPGFAAAALLTIGLGTGVNVLMFSVVDGVLIRPLRYVDPGRLVTISHVDRETGKKVSSISSGEFLDYQANSTTLDALAIATSTGAYMRAGEEQVWVNGAMVSSAFFRVLRTTSGMGRTLSIEDYEPSAEKVGVVTRSFAVSYFGSEAGAIGKRIGSEYTIVGVIPEGFDYPEGSNFWVPYAERSLIGGQYRAFQFRAVARLKAGVSVRHAETELAGMFERIRQSQPPGFSNLGTTVQSLQEHVTGSSRKLLLVLMGAAGCVLLISCLNVANLLFARCAGRAREMAVRGSLGAGRLRLLRQLFTESLVLALAGVAIGVLIASAGLRVFVAFPAAEIPRLNEISLNTHVLWFAAALTVVAAAIFGLIPGVRTLRGIGPGRSAPARRRFSEAAITIQIALSLVLICGAGLLLKDFVLLLNVSLGFEPDRVLTIATPQRDKQFVQRAIQRLEALPGIRAVGAVSGLPVLGPRYTFEPALDGVAQTLPASERQVLLRVTTAGYFRALSIRLLGGRLLSDSDTASSARVAVVNEAFVRRFFPGEQVIGRQLPKGPVLVGIVADSRNVDIASEPVPEMFVPHLQADWLSPATFAVRSAGDPDQLSGIIRAEMRAIGKNMPTRIARLDTLLAPKLAPQRLRTALISIFALLALVLAGVGIYGVINHSVASRAREFGVRLAVGATRGRIVRSVLCQGLYLTAAGVAIGVPSALAAGRVLRGYLYGVSPADPTALICAGGVLVLIGLAACYAPARQAASVDPVLSLRDNQ